MRKLKVLCYDMPDNPPDWGRGVEQAIAPTHHFKFFDRKGPLDQFAEAEAVVDIGGWATNAMIDAARRAGLWQICGTGLDHIDLGHLKRRGIAGSHCPGSTSCVGLGECAMMFILMLSRKWHESQSHLEKGIFFRPMGRTVAGLTLAVVGFGASGRELARRAKGFGMRIEAIDVVPPDAGILSELSPEFVGTPDDLDRVIARCDFLSVHLHLTEETRHIIDARRLALMKPDACVINVARGALIDEEALHRALLEGKLGGAGLDVFSREPPDLSQPALRLPNVVLTPHCSGTTNETLRRRVALIVDNVNRFAEGREILHRVA